MDEPNTLKVEHDGSVVRIEVVTESNYEAIILYEEILESARNGNVTLNVFVIEQDDEIAN